MENTDTKYLVAHACAKWQEDAFFSPESVVLGLDIGMEGIGIAIRKGKELLYCKTLLVDLPEARPMEERRQMRAARHARKNRRVRMRRLRLLFRRHDLPWVSDDVYSRSDPFKLRYRAIKPGANPLASKEALSLCIRSCVERRGYDYFAMSRTGGEYPWGESNALSDAKKWLASAYVDAELEDYLLKLTPLLIHNKKPLDDKTIPVWNELVAQRAALASEAGIPAMLERYSKQKLYERKARGFNYPRSHVESHLRAILERHKHLIKDYDGFVERLFLPCDSKAHKSEAIFHYNRKTPDEANAHFETKVKKCPYAEFIDVPQTRCAQADNSDVRRWNLIDFLSNRTFEFSAKNKLPLGYYHLAPAVIQELADAIAQGRKDVGKKEITAWQKQYDAERVFTPKSKWNDGQFEQLLDIVKPTAAAGRKRASISAESAAAMFNTATQDGTCFDPAQIEAWKKESGLYSHRAKINAEIGDYPQVRELLGVYSEKKHQIVTEGLLQKLFHSPELKDKLSGKTVPDYCVIECVRNAAINKDDAARIKKEQDDNRKRKEKQKETYSRANATHADYVRMRLFEEQGGDVKNSVSAICPFTGASLGCDPFAAELELAHLFPNSKGGLYIAENLVLTTRSVNAAMGNYTPMEAASANLPGWLSAAEMKKQALRFKWGKKKQAIFSFVPTADNPFPEFDNMTRTSQLARSLRRMAAMWMGIADDGEAIRKRIANPDGVHTAAARRSFLWPDYEKDRSGNTHHRWDAAVMTCLPPAAGLNDIRYGGMFYTPNEGNRRLQTITDLPIPDFDAYRHAPEKESPVLKITRRSKYQSLGDSTFWGVFCDDHQPELRGETHQRTSLTPDKVKDADELLSILRKMGIDKVKKADGSIVSYLPTAQQIEKWKASNVAATKAEQKTLVYQPLKLSGGAHIKNVWKFNAKGTLTDSPLGWNGVITEHGKFHQLRNLKEVNDRLEIWLGWDKKKKRWEYYKRIIPVASTLAGLKRLGIPWRGRKNAPDYIIRILDENKAYDMKELICGVLPPHAVKIAQFRKGDVCRLPFKKKKKTDDKSKVSDESYNDTLSIETWGAVSAIRTDTVVEFKCLTFKDRINATPSKASVLLELLGIASGPDELALKMKIKPFI